MASPHMPIIEGTSPQRSLSPYISSPSSSHSGSDSPPSSTDSYRSVYSSSVVSYSVGASCAFPSWPNRSSLGPCPADFVSAHVSDDDLFPDVLEEVDDPQIYQAPRVRSSRAAAPPWRSLHTASAKPKRSGKHSRKEKKSAVPMTPIPEGME
ncbi:MAG: hypothetical protein M4579_001144 [Chaenotheca gracillima]|nr:MAG: hypothetical protein M4579_001144 [Chaenotheca gracillima]